MMVQIQWQLKWCYPPIFIQHWVPIPQWIQKKILLLIFRCLSDLALPYLSDLLHPYTPAQLQLLFSDARFRFNTTGVKAFNCAAPHLWNWFTKNLHYSFISIVAIIFFFMFYNHIIPGFNSFLLLFLIAVAWMDIWVCFQKSAMLKCPTLIQKRACLQARWLPS